MSNVATSQPVQSVEQLSPREREVLTFVGKGFSNREIAVLMQRNISTVNDHLKTIFKKLDVDNRVEAAVLACKAGWL